MTLLSMFASRPAAPRAAVRKDPARAVAAVTPAAGAMSAAAATPADIATPAAGTTTAAGTTMAAGTMTATAANAITMPGTVSDSTSEANLDDWPRWIAQCQLT